jgi:glucose/arabinose dehydrogenase
MKSIYNCLGKTMPLFLCFLFLYTSSNFAQPVIEFNPFISSGLSAPVDITHAGDGSNRLFIVEQGGRIKIYNGTSLLTTPFLNISTLITSGNERGLLSVAFHPDYENNRYFFVYYTNLTGAITIARYRTSATDPNVADANSGVVLLTIPKPFANHNGGDLNFGPDGYLYFGTGDGGSGGDPNNFAQNGNSLLGKMLRIDVNNFDNIPYYTIPADNPYVTDPNVDDRIWSLGLRNPWRWSFDRSTNDMWIADVGQGEREEVNFRSAGNTGKINYGWRCYEGSLPFNTNNCQPVNTYESPIFDYPHDGVTGGFSITGGFVYRGNAYPLLQGYYICADYVSGNVWTIIANGGGWLTNRQAGLPSSISSFGEAEDGTLYAVSLNGQIYTVAATSSLPIQSISAFSGIKLNGYNELKWRATNPQSLHRFVVQSSKDGISFTDVGIVLANQVVTQYTLKHMTNETGKLHYRLQIESLAGTTTYSRIIILNNNYISETKIFPTLITDGIVQISTNQKIKFLQIIDQQGRVVMNKDMKEQDGYFAIPLVNVAKGVYYVHLLTSSGFEKTEIILQ